MCQCGNHNTAGSSDACWLYGFQIYLWEHILYHIRQEKRMVNKCPRVFWDNRLKNLYRRVCHGRKIGLRGTDLKIFTDRSVMEDKSGSRGTFLKKRSSQQMMPMTSGEKPSERLFFQRRICASLPLEDAAILAKACESHTCLSSWGFNSPNVSTSA